MLSSARTAALPTVPAIIPLEVTAYICPAKETPAPTPEATLPPVNPDPTAEVWGGTPAPGTATPAPTQRPSDGGSSGGGSSSGSGSSSGGGSSLDGISVSGSGANAQMIVTIPAGEMLAMI